MPAADGRPRRPRGLEQSVASKQRKTTARRSSVSAAEDAGGVQGTGERRRGRGGDGEAERGLAVQAEAEAPLAEARNAEAGPPQATVALDDDEGPADEVSDARRIYELAAEKLASDPASAADLLRGTVHECDRLLRTSCSASGDSASASDLPPRFYLTYGSALHDLSNLVHLEHDDASGPEAAEDRRQYVALARDLLETGVAKAEQQRPEVDLGEVGELTVALGKVLLLQAEAETGEGGLAAEAAALAENALRKLKKGTENLRRSVTAETDQAWVPHALTVATLVHAHADGRDEPEVRTSWNRWSIRQFDDVLKVDTANVQALEGLGNCYLSISHLYLDQDDSDDEDEGDEHSSAGDDLTAAQARPLLHKAALYYELALKRCTDDADTFRLLCLLAEAQINLGNADDSEEGQQSLYRRAVGLLTRARTMKRDGRANETDDCQFPPQLEAFIEKWETDAS